jgi:hypothetical protein
MHQIQEPEDPEDEVDLKFTECNKVNWLHLGQNRIKMQAAANMLIKLGFP